MLVLGREVGQSLEIHLAKGVDPSMTVGELFHDGPIKIMLVEQSPLWAKIGVDAPRELRVLREEIVGLI